MSDSSVPSYDVLAAQNAQLWAVADAATKYVTARDGRSTQFAYQSLKDALKRLEVRDDR